MLEHLFAEKAYLLLLNLLKKLLYASAFYLFAISFYKCLLYVFIGFFQILNSVDPSYNDPIAITTGDGNNYVEGPLNLSENAQEACVVNETNYVQEQPNNGAMYSLPVQYGMDEKSVKHEYLGGPSNNGVPSNNSNPVNVDHMPDLSFLDATDKLPSGDGAFIETNDLQQPFNLDDPSAFDMLEEYLQFFDATDDNLQNMGLQYSDMFGSEELLSDPAALFPNEVTLHTISQLGFVWHLVLTVLVIALLSGCKQRYQARDWWKAAIRWD